MIYPADKFQTKTITLPFIVVLIDYQSARKSRNRDCCPFLNPVSKHTHMFQVKLLGYSVGHFLQRFISMYSYGTKKNTFHVCGQQSQIAQNVKENAERNSFLTEERNAIQRHFQHLKGKMNKFRAEQAKRLGELTQVRSPCVFLLVVVLLLV